ncbi:fungal hydrophobin [Sanghuangporus baumii]|uniref:Hydrophobin n=1 Tax=Sanghuangporus baumii TaxID=108892 RepID=A0A9Q5I4E0_SANBA|nr:fungal hydrophobin [Sanghuangporus baumii]
MFAKLASFATVALLAVATPAMAQCDTGSLECCTSVQSSDSTPIADLLTLLGIAVQGVDVPLWNSDIDARSSVQEVQAAPLAPSAVKTPATVLLRLDVFQLVSPSESVQLDNYERQGQVLREGDCRVS